MELRGKECTRESMEELVELIGGDRRSQWIWVSSLRLRCSLRVSEGFIRGRRVSTIVIANVEVTTESWRGKGRFTKFHDILYEIAMEQNRVLMIESILNEELEGWVKRRGYEQKDVGMDKTYYHIGTYENCLGH